jgi:hypothetical protein
MDDQTAATPGGAESVPELVRVDPIAGELVTKTFEYDGGRQVTVYVPPDRPEAVVFQDLCLHCKRSEAIFQDRNMPLTCGNVELRGFEPLTSCMPCLAVWSDGIVLSRIAGGPADIGV